MRKTLLTLALFVMTAMAAMAQFKATVEQFPTTDYSPVYAEFTLTEVATALNTDAATLAAALEDGTAQFGLFGEDGALIETTADGPGSYWLKQDGTVTGWGNESVVYNGLINYDAAEDKFVIPVGQFPEAFTGGETWSNTFTLKMGEASVTFEVTLTIKLPAVIADPASLFSELEIVKKYEVTLDLTEGRQYEGKALEVDMADLAAALGCAEEAIADNIAKITLAREFKADDNAGTYAFTDNLMNHRSNEMGTDGWFGRYTVYDEVSGEEYAIAENAPKNWGAGCTIYLQNPEYADGVYSINYGQFPGTLKAGDTDFITLYIVNGTKAAELVIKLNVIEPEKVPFEEMTLAGEQTYDAEIEAAAAYTTVTVDIDVADLLEKLGAASTDDITGWLMQDSTSLADPVPTDYWTGEQGFAQAWGNQAVCHIVPSVGDESGLFTLMQMPRFTTIEEPVTTPIYWIYTYKDKYYKYTFNFTINPIKKVDGELTCVGKEEFQMEIVPSASDWVYGETYQLDLDYIKDKIGTTNFGLYGDKWNAETEKLEWNKNLTCNDGNARGAGFWFGTDTYENEDHQMVVDNAGWGVNSFGFQLSSAGVITWFQYPGQRAIGEEYMANIYLVNEENGKYMRYTIYVKYVDSLSEQTETVGTETITRIVTPEEIADQTLTIDIDPAGLYEATGLESIDELEAAESTVAKSLTMYATGQLDEQFGFKADGYWIDMNVEENYELIAAQAAFTTEEGKLQLVVDLVDVDFSEEAYRMHIGIVVGTSRYMYTVVLGTDAVLGINNIATAKTSGIYSVAGTKLNALKRGVNIVIENGKAKKIVK